MPDERPQIVVVNTTPLIALTALQLLPLLGPPLYPAGVLVPDEVWREYYTDRGSHQVADLAALPGLRRTSLADPRRAKLLCDLDPGEAAVIALGQELNAGLLIIDERLGRRHAMRLDFKVTGTLGVLRRAKTFGLISRLAPLIGAMKANGLRLGDDVVREALRAVNEPIHLPS